MSEIDRQNAKQIRDPMDVLITMTLEDSDVTMSYSGYSSAKVADGVLNKRDWSMRRLADLQGEGFPLDGSCVLYNPSTSASSSNGKLGVRSNIGQSVSVTATGNKVMASITVIVTGAESVTANGTTIQITGNSVMIPVLSTSITMTFNPASETERIEISDIFPDAEFRITNENLIKATVSLRSDLSLFDQTLPESEINVEVYHPVDVAEDVARIPADTPMLYSAGYEGDMSPERRFYIAGQVTWADNVLSIHAVDSVHFLNDYIFHSPLASGEASCFFGLVENVYKELGIHIDGGANQYTNAPEKHCWILREGISARDLAAFCNQFGVVTDRDGACIGEPSVKLRLPLQYSFVDAGRPRLRSYKNVPRANEIIKEEDCAGVTIAHNPQNGVVRVKWERVLEPDWMNIPEMKVGTATFTKNVGTTLAFDKYAFYWEIGLNVGLDFDTDVGKKIAAKYGETASWLWMWPVVPWDTDGYASGITAMPTFYRAWMLGYNNVPQEEYKTAPQSSGAKVYSSFVPWTQKYHNWEYEETYTKKITSASQMWSVLRAAGVVSADSTTLELDMLGRAYELDPQMLTITIDASAITQELDEIPVMGDIAVRKEGSGTTDVVVFPTRMLKTPLLHSHKTGSFTWKGDPRMQPRDVVEWERLDGTREEITLENITLTHEGGGTSAEITYRNGVV